MIADFIVETTLKNQLASYFKHIGTVSKSQTFDFIMFRFDPESRILSYPEGGVKPRALSNGSKIKGEGGGLPLLSRQF
jgi:hypothetical protein